MKFNDLLQNSKFDFCRDVFFENKRLVVFVCVALRAASILKNRVFWYLINVLQVTEYLYLGGFEHRECLRRLSFEK